MREEKQKNTNSVKISHAIYIQAVWMIRNYKRMKLEYEHALWDISLSPMEQPTGNRIEKPTEDQALKRALLSEQIATVNQAVKLIPDQYQRGVLDNIVERKPYPTETDASVYSYYKRKLLYNIAKRLSGIGA